NEQAEIMVYDPKVSEERIYEDLDFLGSRTPEENRRLLKVVKDPYEACKDSHAIAVLTEWDEFKDYNWQKLHDNMIKPAFVFDGRKLLDVQTMKQIGFEYYAIGKGAI